MCDIMPYLYIIRLFNACRLCADVGGLMFLCLMIGGCSGVQQSIIYHIFLLFYFIFLSCARLSGVALWLIVGHCGACLIALLNTYIIYIFIIDLSPPAFGCDFIP